MVESRHYPQDTGERVIAGVFEDGFIAGWGPLIHEAPPYRILTPSGVVCRLKSRFKKQNILLQIQLFAHIEHPPLPILRISCGSETWRSEIDPGWQVLCRRLSPDTDTVDIELNIINADDEPWFELHVTEISIFESDDPRIKNSDT